MTRSGRSARLIGAAAALLLIAHFCATLVYLSPPNLLRLHFQELALAYMHPLFYQNWHLFSPNPGITTVKLAVRCHEPADGWTDWADPIVDFFPHYYHNRVSGYGKLLRAYTYPAMNIRDAIRDGRIACLDGVASNGGSAEDCTVERIAVQLYGGSEVALGTRFAIRACRIGVPSADATQFKLLEFYPLQYTERGKSNLPWSRVDEIVFPETALSPSTAPEGAE